MESSRAVCEDDIEMAFFTGDLLVKIIKIREAASIAFDVSHVRSDFTDRLVELGLATACNEDISTFGYEMQSGRKTDARTANRNERSFLQASLT